MSSDTMVDVEVLNAPENPEELVCTCARNDYSAEDVAALEFEELMEPVDGDILEDKKFKLLKKLMLRGHWGPFEHPQFTFKFRISRVCMAQLTRHRHASFDIQSMRYVPFDEADPESADDFAFPPGVTAAEVQVREGSRTFDDFEDGQSERRDALEDHYARSLARYADLLNAGVPKEDARMVLPLGTKVNVTMSMNVRSLLHIFLMRGAGDAQDEIRSLAESLEDKVAEHMPVTMYIWDEYQEAIQRQRLNP